MAIKSQYSNKCKDCGKSYGIGDSIDTNGNKSANQKGEMKDHWCIDGKNCQGAMQIQGSPKPQVKDPSPEQYIELAKKLLKENPDIKDIGEYIKNVHRATDLLIANVLVKRNLIEIRMNELGLEHPGRRGFIEDVLK